MNKPVSRSSSGGCGERRILLTGYERFAELRQTDLPVPVIEREFSSREHARQFIIRWRLARPNSSRLEIMYLYGLIYDAEKQRHGGDRRSPRARSALGRTAEALADMLGEKVANIRLGARLKKAIETIAHACGRELRDTIPLLFGPEAKLPLKTILDLAAADSARIPQLIGELRLYRKLPAGWRLQGGADETPNTSASETRNGLTQFLFDSAVCPRGPVDAITHRTTTICDAAGLVTGVCG